LATLLLPTGREEPRKLCDIQFLAEEAGFDTVWISEHSQPFTQKGMNSPFQLGLLSAAERTVRVQLGARVTAPICSYDPAIVARAFATLDLYYRNMIFLGLRAREAINESPCGYGWPRIAEHVERSDEAIKPSSAYERGTLTSNENTSTLKKGAFATSLGRGY
jgi:coenzyme F420-dependent glucose-6-phosphate dehydrogenase